jgi:hypothetical protein
MLWAWCWCVQELTRCACLCDCFTLFVSFIVQAGWRRLEGGRQLEAPPGKLVMADVVPEEGDRWMIRYCTRFTCIYQQPPVSSLVVVSCTA